MADHYRAFAEGGFALVISEGIYTDRTFSQGYLHQPGLTDDAQVGAWRSIVEQVHAAGGRMVAQLMHAGALSQGNPHRSGTVGPSAVTPVGAQMVFYRGSGPYPTPRAMEPDDIEEAIEGFATAAVGARDAGFDGIEVHGANGYLLDQFLTAGVNDRTDAYGGPVTARLRLTVETVQRVRETVGPDFLVGVRASQGKVNDYGHRWAGGEEDARVVFSGLASSGVDYVHTTEFEAWRPAFSEDGPSLASLAKAHSGLPVIANGSLHDPVRALQMLDGRHADVVSIGRGALADSNWPERIRQRHGLSEFDREILAPLADLASADKRRAALAAPQLPEAMPLATRTSACRREA